MSPSESDRNNGDSEVFKRPVDLKTKILESSEGSYYLIVIAQGEIDREALKRVCLMKLQRAAGQFSIARCSSILERQA